MKKIWFLLILAFFLVVPYFVLDRENRTLDPQVRAAQTGKFIELSNGLTHFELAGPEEGPPVVLVPDFSLPYFMWDPLFKSLAESGFRVLRFDWYGRGFSDRPSSRYTPEFFENQLLELVRALNLKLPFNLVGISLGGAIGAAFTADHPEMVRTLALIAPTGFPQPPSLFVRLVEIPVLGEYLMAVIGDQYLLGSLKMHFNDEKRLENIKARYAQQMQFKGFKRALLSTMRDTWPYDFSSKFEKVGLLKKPVLLIWGREDHVSPFHLSVRTKALLPGAQFHALEGQGHHPQLERPEVILSILSDFIKDH